jgi:hypothetical protein
MDPSPFELADELCRIAGVADLFAYLGATPDEPAEALQERLRARRKQMQGMQNNPKFKTEALFLIKHVGALTEVLAQPAALDAFLRDRRESANLNVLEVAVRGMLAGAAGARLTADQEAFLRHNATELQISEASFARLLSRLGVAPSNMVGSEAPRHPSGAGAAGSVQPLTASPAMAASPAARRVENETAPPIHRQHMPSPSMGPHRPVRPPAAHLELVSPSEVTVTAADNTSIFVEVRKVGEGLLSGTIDASEPWLIPLQRRLEPDQAEQRIELRILPGLMTTPGPATCTIEAGNAGTVQIVVQLQVVRRWWRSRGVLAGLTTGALGIAAVGGWLLFGSTALEIQVDPPGEVLVNGESVGSGTHVTASGLAPGEVTVEVRGGPRFELYRTAVSLERGHPTQLDVHLVPVSPLAALARTDAPSCEDAPSRKAVGERLVGLKRCVSAMPRSAGVVNVVAELGTEGYPTAYTLRGADVPKDERACIERQLALLRLDPPPVSSCVITFGIPHA